MRSATVGMPNWPRATVRFRNIDPPHRRRKVAPRRQPVPQLVEVVRNISLEGCDRLPVYSSRPLVGLHTFEGFPDFPLGDVERLCLVHGLVPSPVGSRLRLNNAAPSVQPHLQSLHPYYELLRPCAPRRYSGPCSWRRLDVSLKERLNKGWRMEKWNRNFVSHRQGGRLGAVFGRIRLPVRRTSAVRALYFPWQRSR